MNPSFTDDKWRENLWSCHHCYGDINEDNVISNEVVFSNIKS